MNSYQTFIVPYDFSEHARAAADTAADLARRLDASLHLVHVVQPPSFGYGATPAAVPIPLNLVEIRAGALGALQELARSLEPIAGPVQAHVVEGLSIADALQEEAERLGADLIVMGTHGRTGIARVFLGSVAERTLRQAPCPVLTVRSSEEEGVRAQSRTRSDVQPSQQPQGA